MTSTNPFLRHAAQREQAQRADRGTDRPVPPPSAPSLPRNAHAAAPALTPLQAHYLKKSLVQLEIREELAKLARPDALALLGPPFRSSHAAQSTDLPLVRHLFHKFVLTFPFFAAAPPHFFSDKVQLFVERLVERNLIVIDDGNDGTAGVSTMIAKMGKYLAMLVSAGITVSDVREDIVRIREHDHERLARLDTQMLAARGRADSHIDVAGVRRTIERGRLRTKTRDEFLLVSTHGSETVYVARTSKEFEQLHQILLAQFPSEDVPDMPPRDMSATTVNGTLQATDDDGWTDMTAVTPSQLVRERNRHTLRAYLRSVLAIPAVADSEALRSFLTDEPTTLTAADKTDIEMRKRADALRNAEHQAFAQRTTTRVTELQEHLGAFKQQLLEPDGLSRIFATVRRCPHVNELPPEYAVLVDWATVSMASGLFTMFIGSDSSSSTFAQLKYMHGAMPYFMVRSILKISNPLAMMRALLDLFLMQPFGQKSLMQRMFSGRWQEEVAEMKTLTKNILDKLPDPIWARKVDAYLALPQEQQRLFREQARAQHSKDVLVVVLESPLGGDLSAAQRAQLARATTAYQALTRQRHRAQQRGRPEPIPSSRDEWLLEDLHVYLNQCAAIHDKEQLISLVFDNATTELVKDIITIFYAPLAQVYRAANVGDALGDLQVFITDLIKTIEENQARTYPCSPSFCDQYRADRHCVCQSRAAPPADVLPLRAPGARQGLGAVRGPRCVGRAVRAVRARPARDRRPGPRLRRHGALPAARSCRARTRAARGRRGRAVRIPAEAQARAAPSSQDGTCGRVRRGEYAAGRRLVHPRHVGTPRLLGLAERRDRRAQRR